LKEEILLRSLMLFLFSVDDVFNFIVDYQLYVWLLLNAVVIRKPL
jgi:hypothetical protein